MTMHLKHLLGSPARLAWFSAIGLATFQACASSEEAPDDAPFGGGPRRDGGTSATSSSSGDGTSGGGTSSSGGPQRLDIVQIATLVNHTCAVWNDGVLKCWGMNAYGALGQGDTEDRGDEPGEMGRNLAPIDLGTGRKAKRVATGYFFTCAVLDDATVKCWGDNPFCGPDSDDNCGLGYGDKIARGGTPGTMGDNLPAVDLGGAAKDISCGTFGCCALLTNDSIKCWGENMDGLLGYGDELTRGNAPGQMGQNLPPVDVGVSGVATIKMGNTLIQRHGCAALKDGNLKCWGNNSKGQLGLGDTATRGDDLNEMGTALPEVLAGNFVSDIALGDSATCALTAEGQVRCWGSNSYGQLGYGDTTTRGTVAGQNFPLLDLGGKATGIGLSQHACAILESGAVKCWGVNSFPTLDGGTSPSGRLGYGDVLTRGNVPGQMGTNLPAVDLGATEAPLQIVLGSAHACVRFDGGKVKCFGENFRGALGVGDEDTRGDEPSDMGDALPFVDLGR